jgi:hypothetical protein
MAVPLAAERAGIRIGTVRRVGPLARRRLSPYDRLNIHCA